MKRNHLLKALAGSAVIALASLSRAQDAAPSPASPSPADTSAVSGSGAQSGQQGNYVERLAEVLGLTDAQIAQIKTILQTNAGQLKAIEADSSLAQDQKSQQLKALKENLNQQINSVLTPGQQEKFALVEQFVQHHSHRR